MPEGTGHQFASALATIGALTVIAVAGFITGYLAKDEASGFELAGVIVGIFGKALDIPGALSRVLQRPTVQPPSPPPGGVVASEPIPNP